MTRDEAIEILKEIIDEGWLISDFEKCTAIDACEMAIEALEQEPTTKNDLAQERYQDLIEYFGGEEVAKTILEDKKEFKAWLERVKWHVKRADELARELEQLKVTTKNDLGVDAVSRAQVQTEIEMNASRYTISSEYAGMGQIEWTDILIKVSDAVDIIRNLPSVTPQEPILDKIRAEIESKREEVSKKDSEDAQLRAYYYGLNDGLKDARDIIDMYRAESEVEDADSN